MGRLLSETDVLCAFKLIDDLISYLATKPDCRAKRVIVQTLKEQRYHFYHHIFGPKCGAIDLDLLELRGGAPKALTNITMHPWKPAEWSSAIYRILAEKASLKYFEIIADLSTVRFDSPVFNVNGKIMGKTKFKKMLEGL